MAEQVNYMQRVGHVRCIRCAFETSDDMTFDQQDAALMLHLAEKHPNWMFDGAGQKPAEPSPEPEVALKGVCGHCGLIFDPAKNENCPERTNRLSPLPHEPEAAPSLDCDGEIPAIPANSFYVKGTTEPQQASAEPIQRYSIKRYGGVERDDALVPYEWGQVVKTEDHLAQLAALKTCLRECLTMFETAKYARICQIAENARKLLEGK